MTMAEMNRKKPNMPKGQVSDIFTNITKVNYLMRIADFLKQRINQLEQNAKSHEVSY